MRHRCMLIAAALVAVTFATVAQGQLIYEQTFNPPNDPDGYAGAIADSGWTVDTPSPYTFDGTYQGNFAATGLLDAATNQPINGNTGVFAGAPGPLTTAEGMFYVEDGLGGFEAFDPATCERLFFNIYANLQGGGTDDLGYFAIQVRGPDPRDPTTWYVQTAPMAMPASSAEFFDLRSLEYDPTSGWQELTLSPVARGAAAPDLSGMWISGVGIVHSLTNVDGNDFSSWNYADYTITCIPEPSALLLLALATPAWLVFRGRTQLFD